MTQMQVSVLWLVSDHGGIARSDLAKRLQLDRATVMAIGNRLAKRAIRAHEEWLKGRFTATELTTLIALLSRIHG